VISFGHSAKTYLSSATLGKVLLSITTAFTESRTLGTGIRLAKKSLPSVKHSAKGAARRRVVSYRLKPTAVIFAERLVLVLRKETFLPSAPRLTHGRASFA
jgi:hypothetical protein